MFCERTQPLPPAQHGLDGQPLQEPGMYRLCPSRSDMCSLQMLLSSVQRYQAVQQHITFVCRAQTDSNGLPQQQQRLRGWMSTA